MVKASQKICENLIEAGIEYAFGVPGGGTGRIYDVFAEPWAKNKITPILTRHEGHAGCMAEMYGRLTGKPGLLMGQGAWIASNGAFGILEAYHSHTPLLALTDTSDYGFSQHARYQAGTGEYGTVDFRSVFRAITKYTSYAVTGREAVHGVQLGIKHAVQGTPGPSCVLMRNSAITEDVDTAEGPKLYPLRKYLSTSPTLPPGTYIEKALELISKAERPVIIAGHGVRMSRASLDLVQFAETFGIPVATSYKGKSSIPEIHNLALGMMGTFGQPVANKMIAEADLLIVIGCHLGPSDTAGETERLINPDHQKILQIDIDPRSASWTFPADMVLVGDAGTIIRACLDKADGFIPANVDRRIDGIVQSKTAMGFFEADELESDDVPILPMRVVAEIDRILDPSALITLDAGNNRLWMSNLFQCKEPDTLFVPGGAGGMGWGPPAAVAAKLLNPDRQVLSICGDGGFGMVVHVLSTAVQYKLPVVFLVMNDSRLGWVADSQKGLNVACHFTGTDFAAIARGFGCNGISVEKPGEIGTALREGLKSSVPCVIDIKVKPESHTKIQSL